MPPELVVEVLGDDVSWKDVEQKIAEDHAFGVDTVWVIDPRMLALRVYPRGGTPVTLSSRGRRLRCWSWRSPA